jgi:phosphate starvation-inducible PhoH-like protein
MSEATLPLAEPGLALSLFGTRDQHLRAIREALDVAISHREGELRISGDENSVVKATAVLEQLKTLAERQGSLSLDDVKSVLSHVTGNGGVTSFQSIDVVSTSRTIKPRTPGQASYVDAINQFDIVFSIGPAGTGKTYLAVATAVQALKRRTIRKLVLVRPAVEAGESLGFLPGDLQAKINPYLRPLLDALHEMMSHDQIKRFMEQDVIEVVPLAYMRGRTLNDAFVILDEAQNTTAAQMKMFLTRMGEGSKLVIAGDTTQIDLPAHARSGLLDALQRLRQIEGIRVVNLTKSDIVRHRLVQEIVEAYEDPPSGNGVKKTRR